MDDADDEDSHDGDGMNKQLWWPRWPTQKMMVTQPDHMAHISHTVKQTATNHTAKAPSTPCLPTPTHCSVNRSTKSCLDLQNVVHRSTKSCSDLQKSGTHLWKSRHPTHCPVHRSTQVLHKSLIYTSLAQIYKGAVQIHTSPAEIYTIPVQIHASPADLHKSCTDLHKSCI